MRALLLPPHRSAILLPMVTTFYVTYHFFKLFDGFFSVCWWRHDNTMLRTLAAHSASRTVQLLHC
jgi:hypothetical protein